MGEPNNDPLKRAEATIVELERRIAIMEEQQKKHWTEERSLKIDGLEKQIADLTAQLKEYKEGKHAKKEERSAIHDFLFGDDSDDDESDDSGSGS